ncbi:M48 family metallopeptidase [Hirschia maritima]|uniref:M48 family metallopeptidase n=1 Tax=Hirschia maritima TaxID=1121961 RepID=UPI00037D04B4|nr:M48 family metallopeptidase [Hirschia maritima]
MEKTNNRPTVTMSRRDLINGLASGSVVAFSGAAASGCATNEALGRSQLLLVSDGQLAQLAAQSWTSALQQNKQTTDSSLRRRVERVGDKIVQSADRRFPGQNLTQNNWEFAVFDDPTVNAWVMPGGKVGFYTGLLDIMDNDDQVATVMGHEAGHVVGKHSAERYSQQMAAQGGLALANVALEAGDVENSALIAGILGAGVTFGLILPYSRKHEYEADRLGADFMVGADYQANEAVRFWETMTKSSGQKPMEFMSTHPSDTNRISAMQSYISQQGYA